jgi:hypothetical protein
MHNVANYYFKVSVLMSKNYYVNVLKRDKIWTKLNINRAWNNLVYLFEYETVMDLRTILNIK